jgi:hypothetical protein
MEVIETIGRGAGPRGEVVLADVASMRDEVYEELIINGTFAMDSSETSTERLLADLALLRHQRGARAGRRAGLGLHRRCLCAKKSTGSMWCEIEQC